MKSTAIPSRRQFFQPLYEFAHTFLATAGLSNESSKYYASLVKFYTVYKLQRMTRATTRLYLLCFADYRFRQLNDNLIEAFIHLVDHYKKQAKQKWLDYRRRFDDSVVAVLGFDGGSTATIEYLAHAGADFLTVPAAFTRLTGRAHWHVLLRARAIENGCFVFAPAQCGETSQGRQTYGHSLIVAPWGEILAEDGEDPGVIIATIDPARAVEARAMVPALGHDRPFAPPGAGVAGNAAAD